MEQLKKSFDTTEKSFADGLFKNMLDGLSEKFGQEVNKIQSQAEKLNTTLYKISSNINFDNITDGGKLASAFREATQQVEKLQKCFKKREILK